MRKQNLRKVKWDKERNRAYVLRDGVRYWAPDDTSMYCTDKVEVFNPDTKTITVRCGGTRETWRADATSSGIVG